MSITIVNLQYKVPVFSSKTKSVARKALLKLKLKDFDLSIVFVGRKRMRTLNKIYLRHDYVTDVIAFEHGEIVICPSVAMVNARRFGYALEREILLYVVHGILHLAGYDDHAPAEIKKMRDKERDILREA